MLYSAALTDRFGDYGLIGILQLQPAADVLMIENMALSCRALGRGVEDSLLAFAHSRARAAGCKRLAVNAARGVFHADRQRRLPRTSPRFG